MKTRGSETQCKAFKAHDAVLPPSHIHRGGTKVGTSYSVNVLITVVCTMSLIFWTFHSR